VRAKDAVKHTCPASMRPWVGALALKKKKTKTQKKTSKITQKRKTKNQPQQINKTNKQSVGGMKRTKVS
jgi:hypothetical protein